MILPKKIELDKARQTERKREIDDGVKLATKVDELRRLKVGLETSLSAWRKESMKAVQDEIDSLVRQKEDLEADLRDGRRINAELRKPLTEEWAKLNTEKATFAESKKELYLDTERFKIKEQNLTKEAESIGELKTKVKKSLKNAENLEKQAEALRNEAQTERNTASLERIAQQNTYEAKLKELEQLETQYTVGLQTIGIREKQVDEKEAELIIRENTLARRTKNFQRAMEVKNG